MVTASNVSNVFKVMYWRYTNKANRQIWYEFDSYKSALKKLDNLGDKGIHALLYCNDKLIDYRN